MLLLLGAGSKKPCARHGINARTATPRRRREAAVVVANPATEGDDRRHAAPLLILLPATAMLPSLPAGLWRGATA